MELNDSYTCPICKRLDITTRVRFEYRHGNLIKATCCQGCWKDLLDIDDAMWVMNGEGA